jgi:2-polyprenyl-3-methyl-5-hydroxy-6-metoxy-1,4-benzoquinol methylase
LDAQERLTREEALAPTTLGSMHVHRYALAAELCRGLRVADIGCGTGYGSDILARESPFVVGVDLDEETILAAAEELGKPGRLEFEVADATDFLRERLRDRFDAIVMLETLEHLSGLDDVLVSLRRQAEDGLRLVVSVPNSRMLDEENPYHTFDFGYDEAKAAFAGLPDTTFVYQFLADGSVMQAEEPDGSEGRFTLGEPGEREYAQQFVALVNFGERANETTAVMHVQADPLNQRYLTGLERANEELRRTNERLARGWRGVADSAAAALVAKAERLEEALTEVQKQRRWTPEDERMVAGLHEEIAGLNRTIAEMQGTRAWRVASSYWSFKRLFRPGRGT